MKMNVRTRKWLAAASISAIVLAVLAGSVASATPSRKKAGTAASRTATTSFHFDDIPVRSALQLLAEEGRFNLVVSDSVQGNITLRLKDVTWEQALATVLRMKGLQQRVDGNTRSVAAAGG